jgi:allantoate deiminase
MADTRADTIMERCDALARASDEPGRLTRRYGSAAMRQANAAVAGWMRSCGMSVRQDAVGNLVGRFGTGRALILGSHLDTVRDAGKYDGALGVLVAVAAVERLQERRIQPPFAVEVIAFADEEGLRFHSTYLGSRAVAGTFDLATLDLRDAEGVRLADAIRAFGGDPEAIARERRTSEEVAGYCEVHIEQGPVLEGLGFPVGVVSAITGQSRIEARLEGEAGHAGTLPMPARRDALCGAAEVILAAESLARRTPGLVATTGRVDVAPGASNVVPGAAALTLDVRHPEDAARRAAVEALSKRAAEIATGRGLRLDWRVVQDCGAVACDPALSALLARAVADAGLTVHRLPSGAGHDAAVLAALAPVAMLFVRCHGGISHNPAESVSTSDVAVAIRVVDRFFDLMAEAFEQRGAPRKEAG